ncbi:GNAT family N-acetyltransferase [Microvirga sp. M2]|uniref:GNAT family N-acetyltransferase n=1 Tax=Microvirga sp. M2 TaxID=3073270 RepID=UPI0039C37F7D
MDTGTGFDAQPRLTSPVLELRPLRRDDFDGLFSAAAHPEVWAGHPAKDRHRRDVFEKYFDFLMGTRSTLAIIDRPSGKIIGCSRYYTSPDRPDAIAIGFTFLNHAYWGGDVNFELKRLMLDHAFGTYPEVWFHIGPDNVRSRKATAKLGADYVAEATLDLSGTAAPYLCFRLTRDAWRRTLEARGAPSIDTES